MVGGIVIEVAEIKDRPGVLFVDCRDTHNRDTCAILVELNDTSRRIDIGDSVWWQGRTAYWTPLGAMRVGDGGQCGVDYDLPVKRIGYSGVRHPYRAEKECEGK